MEQLRQVEAAKVRTLPVASPTTHEQQLDLQMIGIELSQRPGGFPFVFRHITTFLVANLVFGVVAFIVTLATLIHHNVNWILSLILAVLAFLAVRIVFARTLLYFLAKSLGRFD